MKRILLALVIAVFATTAYSQKIIHYWSFNSGAASKSDSAWVSPVSADSTLASPDTAYLSHNIAHTEDFGGNTSNAPTGVSSGSAFVVRNNANNGKNFVLNLPTTNKKVDELSWWTRRTGSGFDSLIVEYTTNGTTYKKHTQSPILVTSTSSSGAIFKLAFDTVSGVDSNANFKVRITVYGATGATGNARFDNIKLTEKSSTPPPPPAPIPHYNISVVTTENASGVADSNNVKCSVSGVVYGVDMSGTGSSNNGFTVIDGTGGIAVFKGGGFTPAYVVTESDSVTLYGKISQYNGLTQFSPDSIKKHKTGSTLKVARKVTSLGEATESDLIKIDSVTLVNASQWPSAGNNANVQIRTQAGDTLIMRIDRDTDVDDSITVAPTGRFDVCGLGGQFDSSSPYASGYQILPRYKADIKISATPPPPPASMPHYNISVVTTEDTNGVADSANVKCSVSGVVYGVDMNGTSSSNGFTVIDGTGGIFVFKRNGFTPAYVVTETDSVTLYGEIGQFNGLTQFYPDSIKLHKTGASLKAATKVSMLNESTESDLIKIDSVTLVNASQWPSAGNNANVQIRTQAGDTLVMRIDRDTDVDDSITVAPTGMFTVCGLGGQFDASSPYNSGYQILPRYKADVKVGTTPPPPPPAGLPHYNLGVVTTEDTSGVADSNNVKCSVSGVVHGIDMSGLTSSSNTFQLFDATGHITVYKRNGFTPAYTVNESDSVTLYGRITQYNGLTQFNPDSIKVHSTGAALKNWRKVTDLNESTESDYIRIDSVKLVDATQWPTVGNNANVQIETTAGDTLIMRIDRDSYVDDSVAAPAAYFHVIGYGGQFDFSSPYTSGYQILPQLKQHIIIPVPATCNAPSGLGSQNITTTSAELTWVTGGSNLWNIEWDTAGFTRGTGNKVTTSMNPYSLSGLTLGKAYDFYVQDSCAGNGTSAWSGPHTFTTLASTPVIPLYDMNVLRTYDANGELDSANVECAIEGIVVTKNMSAAGASGPDVSFVIVEEDNSTGFTAISFRDTAAIGYAPNVGDSVRLYGKVGQFRGLSQFQVDSAKVHSQNVSLPEPYCTDSLSEMTESRYLQLTDLTIADTNWATVGSDANVKVTNAKGDTLLMRIDQHTDVASVWANAPTGKFSLLAVGGQYDFGAPYLEGYQVFPRFGSDIDTSVFCVDPSGLTVSKIGADSAVASWTGGGKGSAWNIKWGETTASDSLMDISTTSETLLGLNANTEYTVWVQEICCGGSTSAWIKTTFTTLETSIETVNGSNTNLVAFPNPNGIGEVRFNKEVSVTIRNILGQPVKSGNNVTSLNISDLEAGVYLINSEAGDTIRLIVR